MKIMCGNTLKTGFNALEIHNCENYCIKTIYYLTNLKQKSPQNDLLYNKQMQ